MGILAFELLVGYPPFEQESRAQVREAGSSEGGVHNLQGGMGICVHPGREAFCADHVLGSGLTLSNRPPPPSLPNPTQTYEQIMYKDPRFPSTCLSVPIRLPRNRPSLPPIDLRADHVQGSALPLWPELRG